MNTKGETILDLQARLYAAMAEPDPAEAEAAFMALVFRGASTSEPRGVSDANLVDEALWRLIEVLRGGGEKYRPTVDWIFGYLDTERVG